MARSNDPEKFLDAELLNLKKRALELNSARQTMAIGYEKVLEGLKIAYPDLDMNDKNLNRSQSNSVIAGVCGGLGDYLNVDPILFRVLFVFKFASLYVHFFKFRLDKPRTIMQVF